MLKQIALAQKEYGVNWDGDDQKVGWCQIIYKSWKISVLNEEMKLIKIRTKYINETNTQISNSLEINFDFKKLIIFIIYQVRLKTLKFHLNWYLI